MSVFGGEIDFHSVTMVDYVEKKKPLDPRPHPTDDNCLLVSLFRDGLRAREQPRRVPDVLCPLDQEYYKFAVKRFEEDYPKLVEMYMRKDIDPTPIDHEIQDLKRTEYLTKYCSRELPFMSVNLTRRAKALQTLRLPDDVTIPDTSAANSYRAPNKAKYKDPPSALSCRPKYEDSLMKELRRILRIQTGDSTYTFNHGLLGQVILNNNPFGKPREEPKFGKWKKRNVYTYQL